MYQLAWTTSSRSNQGSSSSMPFSARVFCMSKGRPRRFQMQLAPCLLNLRYRLSISRMVSSAGTSSTVQWSLIMFMIRILLAFLVSLPIMFLESFHHFTSLSELTCRQAPVGQQNSRLPVCRFTLTLGSRLLLSNQQVMSVPAASMRGVVRALEMFSWIIRVRLQTSPKRITQQSLAVLWLLTSSRVQYLCLGACTGRYCFRPSLAARLMRSYIITHSYLKYKQNMKISAPSKFVPSLFHTPAPHLDDFYHQPSAKPTDTQPFRPIQNVLQKGTKNSYGKHRLPKVFLSISSEQESPVKNDTPIAEGQKPSEERKSEIEEQTIQAEESASYPHNKSNMLCVEIDSSSNDSDKPKKIEQQAYEEILALPASRNMEKLHLESSSNSQQNNQSQPQTLIRQTQAGPMAKEQLFERLMGGTLRCLLRRDKKSPSGFIQYNLYLQGSLQHLLTIRKETFCQYRFYCRQKLPDEPFFHYTPIAVLQSNFLGSKYTLLPVNQKYSNITICYQTNILGLSGPRKFFVYLPKTQLPFEYLHECYEEGHFRDQIKKCVSRTAKWNQKAKSYVLNFQGRAKESSIKNFVITDTEESEHSNFLIFGKAAPDVYNLDIQSPFSILQGAAVALTSFERKVTCD